jgi:protein involved in polysaccharide export with SLBB domain
MKKTFIYFFIICFSTIYAQEKNTQQNQLSLPPISVTVGGKFIVNGTFPAMITERVDQFITRIYNAAKENSLSVAKDLQTAETINKGINQDYAIRGIILKRADGEEKKIDLAKFRVNGDFNNNPYLKNDDVLIFPAVDLDRNFIRITGAVNNPAKFMYVDGDNLSDAIDLAQGINKAYENVKKVHINRLSYDGEHQETITVNVDDKTPLKRGDQIVVVADETQRKDFYVLVLGEVNRSGYFPITKDSTTLGEIINLVNGFTPNASLKRARIFRGNSITPLLEREYGVKISDELLNQNQTLVDRIVNYEQAMMIRMSNLVQEDKDYFEVENQYRVLNEGSAIDFTQINDKNSDIYNFILQSGDVIIIPPVTNTVYVFGQVSNPGHVKYIKNKDYMYYITQAGGLGEYAEKDIMVIKGDSRNWVTADPSVKIDDGDFIFVPKERIRSFQSTIAEWGVYTSIVGTIATVLLLIVQLTK